MKKPLPGDGRPVGADQTDVVLLLDKIARSQVPPATT